MRNVLICIYVAMKAALPTDFWNHKLDRMDPELAKALREGVATTPPGSFHTDFAGNPYEHYTQVSSPDQSTKKKSRPLLTQLQSQVDKVVEKHWGLEKTHALLAERHQDLAHLRFNEERVNATNEQYRHDIRRLKHENRKLGECLVQHLETRDRRIMKSVYDHVRGLDYEAKAKLAELKARWKENGELRDEYEEMKEMQEKMLKPFGKNSPEEVFKMFPDIWESLEERKNRRNFS